MRVLWLLAVGLGVAACSGAGTTGDDDGSDAAGDGSVPGDAADRDGEPWEDGAEAGVALPPPTCGDGVLDPGEECDDGNRVNLDDCDWACRLGEGSYFPPRSDASPGGVEPARAPAFVDDATTARSCVADAPLVWGETNYATVWSACDPSGLVLETVFLRFDVDGRRVGPEWWFRSPDPIPSHDLDMVWNGDGYGLVWCADGAPLRFVELDREGKPLYPPVEPLPDVTDCDPALVWDGETYGLFWTMHRGIDCPVASECGHLRYVRLASRGVLRSEVVGVHHDDRGGVHSPDAATSGATHLVVFVDHPDSCGNSCEGGCGRVATVAPTGEIVRRAVGLSGIGTLDPVVAWGDDRFGVLHDTCARDTELPNNYFDAWSADGDLLGPPRPLLGRGLRPLLSVHPADLAWGAGGWAVALVGHGYEEGGVMRLDRAGAFLDDVEFDPLDFPLAWYGHLAVAFDGGGFGVLSLEDEGPVFARVALEPWD